MNITITANDLKVKGVSLIDCVVEKNESEIISVHGKDKYVVLKISEYNKLRELELENAIKETKADIASGKFYTDGISEHMKRVSGV